MYRNAYIHACTNVHTCTAWTIIDVYRFNMYMHMYAFMYSLIQVHIHVRQHMHVCEYSYRLSMNPKFGIYGKKCANVSSGPEVVARPCTNGRGGYCRKLQMRMVPQRGKCNPTKTRRVVACYLELTQHHCESAAFHGNNETIVTFGVRRIATPGTKKQDFAKCHAPVPAESRVAM